MLGGGRGGGASICLCVTERVLGRSIDPPEGHPGQLAYTFVICTATMALTQFSTFSGHCYRFTLCDNMDKMCPVVRRKGQRRNRSLSALSAGAYTPQLGS
jgi:hypothetical protein